MAKIPITIMANILWSNFRCIKYVRTRTLLTDASKRAIVTVKAPSSMLVTATEIMVNTTSVRRIIT